MSRLLEIGGSRARSIAPHAGSPLHHLEEGSGRPVVLLHGGSGGGANWFRLLAPLSGRYRVLAPDLPGFGLSPHGQPRPPLGRHAADVLHEWLVGNDISGALLAGTSFGGLAAMRLAQRAPDRVDRLLLLASAGLGRHLHLLVRIACAPGLTSAAVRPTRGGTRALFRRLLTSNRSDMPADTQQALVDYLHASARAAGTAYAASTLRLFADLRGQREVLTDAELNALPQPVSIVWGELDSFLPLSHARRAAACCRDARLTIVPDAGHSPNWERPGPVIAAIDELAGRSAP
jgi:pimeloyl-ACP methyl ester carboxylesterase